MRLTDKYVHRKSYSIGDIVILRGASLGPAPNGNDCALVSANEGYLALTCWSLESSASYLQ